MIQLTSKGEWTKTRNWLNKVGKPKPYLEQMRKYGQLGVEALKNHTPVLTGTTAESWYYEIVQEKKGVYKIIWCNRNLVDEWYNVALFIQLGHGTPSGVWVEGIDYINPALRTIFTDLADKAWDEYTHNVY